MKGFMLSFTCRSMQEIQLDKHIQLLDSPGIVMATGETDAHTILRNCVAVETIDDPSTAVHAILRRCPKQQVHKITVLTHPPIFSVALVVVLKRISCMKLFVKVYWYLDLDVYNC